MTLEEKDFEDFNSLIQTECGARFISRVIDYCRLNAQIYSPDHSAMAFNDGRRNVGLMLMSLVEGDEQYEDRLREATRYRLRLFREDERKAKEDAERTVYEKAKSRRRNTDGGK